MMAKHTEGPWEIDRSRRYYKPCIRHNGVVITLVHDNPTDAEKANDRLICAAPELLEALKQANEETKLYEGHPGRWADLIAKAEGK